MLKILAKSSTALGGSLSDVFSARCSLPTLNRLSWRGFGNVPAKPRVTLYSKASDCSLCDDAKSALEKYRHLFELEYVDITLPEFREWFSRYQYDIPVIHLNGNFLMKHRVDIHLLQKSIAEASSNENKS